MRGKTFCNVNDILEALEKMYGPQHAAGPIDPYEMLGVLELRLSGQRYGVFERNLKR